MPITIPVDRIPKADNSSPRECKKCKKVKEIDLFAKQQMNRRSHTCKDCSREIARKRRREKKEKEATLHQKILMARFADMAKRNK